MSSIHRGKREPDNDERNKQIAYELSVSEATVKANVSAIFQKLRVESRTQALILATKIEAAQEPLIAS